MTINRIGSLLTPVAVLALVLTGCDATGPTDTVILSENSVIPPTVEYTFDYETNGGRPIGVVSQEADDLDSILEQNGFRRADVESARVDSVRLERLSSPETAAVAPKVFDYLTGATLYLGSGTEGTRVASAMFETTNLSVRLPVDRRDVTAVVQNGSANAFLQLSTTDDVSDRRDRVKATVYFRLEVGGV